MNSDINDDIVTRLRAEANRLRFVAGGTSLVVVSPSLQDEAASEIERLRNALAEQTIIHEVQKTNTLSEIERLRRCLQHAIDHVGKWQLFTVEEKQTVLAEYEQAVRGD